MGDEVLDHAPLALTHREKLVLLVLAKDANERTRLTWSSVQDPKILKRAKVSRSQMFEVLKTLQDKGVLKKVVVGQKNASAKYEIARLGPVQSPEIPDTETEDNESQSPGIRDTDESQCPENPDTEAEVQSPEIRDTETAQSPGSRDTENSQSPGIRDAYSTTRTQAGTPAYDDRVDIPDWARPLIAELEALGITLSWKHRMTQLRWVQLQLLIRSYGVPYLVHLARLRWDPDKPIKFATLLIDIWQRDYEAPAPGSKWHPDTIARETQPGSSQSAPEPDWCGTCDGPDHRFIETDGRVYRCPTCHPGAAA